jgi:hypothetical protein
MRNKKRYHENETTEGIGIFRTNEMQMKLNDVRRRERPDVIKHQKGVSNDWNP